MRWVRVGRYANWLPAFCVLQLCMGSASTALSHVFDSCSFVPTNLSQSSSSSHVTIDGRDVIDPEAEKKSKNRWVVCLDQDEELVDPPHEELHVAGPRHGEQAVNIRKVSSAASTRQSEALQKIEVMMKELFDLQDLNKNGVLEEIELIKLNEKIAMLHHGKDTDRSAVKQQYKELFRSKLDPNGEPVPFPTFRRYMLELLDGMDKDRLAQELILEQFIAEAKSGRVAFHCPSFHSVTDLPYRAKIEDRGPMLSARSSDRRLPTTAGA